MARLSDFYFLKVMEEGFQVKSELQVVKFAFLMGWKHFHGRHTTRYE